MIKITLCEHSPNGRIKKDHVPHPAQIYDTIYVTHVELDEEVIDLHKSISPDQSMPSLMTILEMITFLPLRHQALMMANLLTISGYQQKEIAEALGMEYKTFRNYLWEMRKEFKARGLSTV